MDLNSGGPANALGKGSVFDIHSYPYPRIPVGAAPGQFNMIGVRLPIQLYPPTIVPIVKMIGVQ